LQFGQGGELAAFQIGLMTDKVLSPSDISCKLGLRKYKKFVHIVKRILYFGFLMANYGRTGIDNVIVPYAADCQTVSLFQRPFKDLEEGPEKVSFQIQICH
jgi:hypothetical protein